MCIKVFTKHVNFYNADFKSGRIKDNTNTNCIIKKLR